MVVGSDLLLLALLMLATGAVGGVIAGLLGVGGGIVIVPVLELALGVAGVDAAIRMHVAVATSLATIIPTSISSARAHHRRGAVDLDLARRWGALVFAGAVLGTIIAAFVTSAVLALVFATVALLVAAKMILPLDHVTIAPELPRGVAAAPLPLATGTISSLMGIGGGTISVPLLSLFGYPIHRAVGTAAIFGLVIGIPGTIGYIVSGWGDPRLPAFSLGYVNLAGLLFIGPMTALTAPWGARIAHALSKRHLSLFFGAFLLLVSIRMFYRAFA